MKEIRPASVGAHITRPGRGIDLTLPDVIVKPHVTLNINRGLASGKVDRIALTAQQARKLAAELLGASLQVEGV